jgi:hypothetical protein
MSAEHLEPYLYLAGLRHDSVLIAWGGFYFKTSSSSGALKLVDDSDLRKVTPPRKETIGARSTPYGPARVEVRNLNNELVAQAETAGKNHLWVDGLAPDTEYTYRVLVNGNPWAEGELLDWDETRNGLAASGGRYNNRFRTHPAPTESAPLGFAVIGDFGVGVRKPSSDTRKQRDIARALAHAVASHGVRLVLTTGDNIYAGRTFLHIPLGSTGDEDDDWFFTFYQPYRYVINRVPVYPAVGNHDTMETEASDDREQMEDNFFIHDRFSGPRAAGPISRDPGLFYRFGYGRDIEFVCLDTTRRWFFGSRFYEHKKHREFMESAFAGGGAAASRWVIPFMHHPVYTAGPTHRIHKSMIEGLGGRFERGGIRVALAGHEHNYQHSHHNGIHYFVSGSAGKVNSGTPTRFAEAHTVAWAKAAHLLLVEVTGSQMKVRPISGIGANGGLAELQVIREGQQAAGSVSISLDG